ncbi:hypothetical protein KY290_021453 [Solanum tuberosum]|uniref:Uncharacterized protein n=1 Tax=Solanum tuberosum TaxID=4113 RepID=A0ABQ7V4Q0_SOLTU|nr:hypothetical protein KY285_020358 [Solanum tuberosum]KAH0757960.1 hypothetical protein KY290_021453 [Solanum tuberosum]
MPYASKIKPTSPRCALSTPLASKESSSVFMPIPGFIASSSQQSSQPDEKLVAPSGAVADEEEGEIECDDEQPSLRPKKISEARTRFQAKKIQIRPTNTGRIDIKGYENGVSMPTNLPYSPRKLAFKGKIAMSSNQLIVEKEKRIGKLKAKRGGEECYVMA